MVYDYVILKDGSADKMQDDYLNNYKGKKLLIYRCNEMPGYEPQDEIVAKARGILLEITGEGRYLTLQIMSEPGCVKRIHSRNIIIVEAISHAQERYVSLYELLWAAGVKIDDETLLPVTAEKGETSIRGLYYRPPALRAE